MSKKLKKKMYKCASCGRMNHQDEQYTVNGKSYCASMKCLRQRYGLSTRMCPRCKKEYTVFNVIYSECPDC